MPGPATDALVAQAFAQSTPQGPDYQSIMSPNIWRNMTASHFAAYSGFKGANTILRGGWAGDVSQNTWVNKFRPSSMFRHARVEGMTRHAPGTNHYFFDRPVNWVAGQFGYKGDLYSGGMLAQLDAAARMSGKNAGRDVASMTRRTFPGFRRRPVDIAGGVNSYRDAMGTGAIADSRRFVVDSAGGAAEEAVRGIATGQDAARAILTAAPGAINQVVGGAFYGARYGQMSAAEIQGLGEGTGRFVAANRVIGGWKELGGTGDVGMRQGFRTAYASQFDRGLSEAGGDVASKVAMMAAKKAGWEGVTKFGASLALKGIGMAIPGLDIVMGIQLIASFAKLAGTVWSDYVYNPARKFAGDAYKSMTGAIGKGPFGMGFQDNPVAATSRARGVMAISNSRLNARSVLGSEASFLANYYG